MLDNTRPSHCWLLKFTAFVCVVSFYERWKQAEAMHAEMLQFSLDDDQWEQDWAVILSIASQPGHCLSLIDMNHSHIVVIIIIIVDVMSEQGSANFLGSRAG